MSHDSIVRLHTWYIGAGRPLLDRFGALYLVSLSGACGQYLPYGAYCIRAGSRGLDSDDVGISRKTWSRLRCRLIYIRELNVRLATLCHSFDGPILGF
jgi:hypothetical protein